MNRGSVPTNNDVHSRLMNNDQCMVIDIEGFFTVQCLEKFIAAYESKPPLSRYAVNLENCNGIDSSGLGMLLMLRDYSKLEQKDLLISHCSPPVLNVLSYSKFDQLFTILN